MVSRSRSILQLVLLGLLVVVAPLCVAIIYTVQTLDALSQKGASLSEAVVSITRVTQVLQSDILDLERRARQYLTLEDDNLLNLFREERLRLLARVENLDELQTPAPPGDGRLPEARRELTEALQALPESGAALAEQMQRFTDLYRANEQFQLLSQQYVDRRLQDYRADADRIRHSLMLLVAVLGLLTVVLSLVFIYWLGRPIRQLEEEIRRLGQSGPGRAINVSGPREVQALAQQLEWLRDQLGQAESRKQQFLMHMSHELKTPLASLREGAELLADGVAGSLDSRQREITEIMLESSRELQRLIENLLDYNRAEHRSGLNSESVNLHDLCRELLQSHSISVRRKQLQVNFEVPEAEWLTDPDKLRTVIDNLLSNAVNYTPDGGTIELSSSAGASVLVVEVANTGQPIPEAERTRIFQPFFQGSNSRSGAIKGSGIGLFVASDCVGDLGGHLELVERPGYAVCFRITLPAVEQVAA